MKNSWIIRFLSEDSQILKKIGAKPGHYHIMFDTSAQSVRIKNDRKGKEYEQISLKKTKSQDALMILKELEKLESSKPVEENPYRFNCALQTGDDTVDSAFANGLYYDKPPTAKEAIEVVEKLRRKGKSALKNDAHGEFNYAIDQVIKWLEAKAGLGYTPSGNYDITEARKKFKYNGTTYRVDIKACGKTSGDPWFK
ncbi:MAG: hypothetical protein ACRCU2_29490 [Planktothrix sp.]